MNEKEMEALNHILKYVEERVETEYRLGERAALQYDSITLRDWLNYQIDMQADTRVSNDAKRAAARTRAKERN